MKFKIEDNKNIKTGIENQTNNNQGTKQKTLSQLESKGS